MKAKATKINKGTIIDIVRGTLIASIASLIGVLVLALVVKLTGISDGVILPINQVIKIISILLGCILGIKLKTNGAIKGAIIGLLYTLVSIFVFLVVEKSLNAASFSFIDLVAGIVSGTVSGIISVNFGRK